MFKKFRPLGLFSKPRSHGNHKIVQSSDSDDLFNFVTQGI